jgi:hypothetical protein
VKQHNNNNNNNNNNKKNNKNTAVTSSQIVAGKPSGFIFFGSNWCSQFSLYLVLAPTGGPSLSLGSSYCKKQLMIDDDKINENKMLYNCHRNCIRQPGAT